MSQATVKVAGYVAEPTRQRENVADSFNHALNVAPCSGCGKPTAWITSGSRGNAIAGKWMGEEAVKHCPVCTPAAKSGAFRVRSSVDGDAIALAVTDKIAHVAPSANGNVDATKLALAQLLEALQAGSITPVQYAESVAALSA